MNAEEIASIKLVIWDLDNTFWNGILSEGEVKVSDDNVKLIRDMVDSGVMCSICSKNDSNKVREEMERIGIWDYFVFNSINWSAKGERVKQIIQGMKLRERNVLFIDDNQMNREEVKSFCPLISVSDENVILELRTFFSHCLHQDSSHVRLNQYKLLESKQEFRASFGSNEEFLVKSGITVEIKYDCVNHLDRIADLVKRSNQLNFTKLRSSEEELLQTINEKDVLSGYVEVQDIFGDYGIVGFYAIKNEELIHFVFSCRVLSMGIEQYVFSCLKEPKINVIGEVSSDLYSPKPYWINSVKNQTQGTRKKLTGKIVFKGPCDISQIFSYIVKTNDMSLEFTYVNDKGVSIEGRNHSTQVVESKTLSNETKQRLIKTLPFGDPDMFETSIYDDDVSFIVFSLFTDPNLGLYKENETGAIVAFGEYTNDLTNESIWEDIKSQKLFTAGCHFTQDDLENFKKDFSFIGRLNPQEILDNLNFILSEISPQAKVILCMGSETPFEKNEKPAYADRHIFNKELNEKVRIWAQGKPNVFLLDFNEFITGQESFSDNINHFTREIYYRLSSKIVSIIATNGSRIRAKNYLCQGIIRWLKHSVKMVFRKIGLMQ